MTVRVNKFLEKALQDKIDNVVENIAGLTSAVTRLTAAKAVLQEEIASLDTKLAALSADVTDKTAILSEYQAELALIKAR